MNTPLFEALPCTMYSTDKIIRALQAEPQRFTGSVTAPALKSKVKAMYATLLGDETRVVLLQKIKNGRGQVHGHTLTLQQAPQQEGFILASRDYETKSFRGDNHRLKYDTYAHIDAQGKPHEVFGHPLLSLQVDSHKMTLRDATCYDGLSQLMNGKVYQMALRRRMTVNELTMPTAHLYQFLQGQAVYGIPAEVYIGKTGAKSTRMVQLSTKRDLYSLPKPMFKAFEQATKLFSKLQPGAFIQRG